MFTSLINLFFPRVCSGCQSFLLTNEIVICTACRHEIPLTHHHLLTDNEVFSRFYGRIPIEFGAAFAYFNKKGIVQELIHQLKYKGNEDVGAVIGSWYAEILKDLIVDKKIDCIIPVPLHVKKLRERGYNQVSSFGMALSKNWQIEYNNSVLIRKSYSKTQTKKTLLGRSEIIGNLFEVNFDQTHHNKHFLLIDDVITTGATLEACGSALLKIPGAKLSILCIAQST